MNETPPTTVGAPAVAAADHPEKLPDKLDARLLRIGAVCGLAALMGFLDSTAVAVAQRAFAAEFNSTPAVVSWTIAGYLLAFAAVVPVTGWAADRFGTKRLFIGAVALFTAASLLCAIAPNILSLIVFRALQGAGAGILSPLSFVIATKEAGPKRLGRLVAVGAIPFLLGPVGGPILGGWLIGTYGWQWIFLINLPIGLITLVLAAAMFPRDRPAPWEALDVLGLFLLSPGFAVLLAGVSAIPEHHGVVNAHVVLPLTLGLVLIGLFVVHAWRRGDHPLVDLRLFRNRVVTLSNLTLLLFAATYVGVLLLVPSYFQAGLHQTPMESGLHLIAMGVGVVVTTPIAGAGMDKFGPGRMVLLGFPLMAVGLGVFTLGVARHAHYTPTLLVGLLIAGLGIGCAATPLSAGCMQSLAAHQVARGTTLLGINDQLGGAIGAALLATLLTKQLTGHGDPAAPPELAHAYATVFAVATAMAVCTIIPAAFLPRRPALDPPEQRN